MFGQTVANFEVSIKVPVDHSLSILGLQQQTQPARGRYLVCEFTENIQKLQYWGKQTVGLRQFVTLYSPITESKLLFRQNSNQTPLARNVELEQRRQPGHISVKVPIPKPTQSATSDNHPPLRR